ncbi:MAG: hypothetical protein JWO87_3288 [Phycisphaerales bacterium]|jgi:hypothetical protein|nr:hypothetical protein [Phycisphaerales bacterium]MDB5301625.1 hypothetical protein [Phycisphaerales bacterium]
MMRREPPKPTHVPGTNKGEELVIKRGREPGRGEPGTRGYRNARDSTSINAGAEEPIDPRMPEMPPP